VRPLGPDGRPIAPALIVRLSVPLPQPGSGSPRSNPVLASSGASASTGVPPATSGPARHALPPNTGIPAATTRPVAALTPPTVPGPATAATGLPSAPPAILEHLSVLAAQGRALEAVVLPRDALGRVLLRVAGLALRVDTPLDLPVGARLQMSLPAGPARFGLALPKAGPLEAVRTLAASLRGQAGVVEPVHTGAMRLPEPDATLASYLLRLVQLIVPRSGGTDVRHPAEAALAEGQPGAARVTAALAELGRVAGEPQHGGWRVLLLPLAFEGAPLLRLYLREDPADANDGCPDHEADGPRGSRRAVFEVEFGALGRCQIDVLSQARRFDLLVRTEQPLPPDLRSDIRELYVAARDAAGLLGTARFRAGQLLALPEPTGAGGATGITV
jgi:hypothetical protein